MKKRHSPARSFPLPTPRSKWSGINILFYATLLMLCGCSKRCPSGDAPYTNVCFIGTWKIKNVYGIGGGKIVQPETNRGDGSYYQNSNCDTSFVLQLAISKDITRYVFEHDTGHVVSTID